MRPTEVTITDDVTDASVTLQIEVRSDHIYIRQAGPTEPECAGVAVEYREGWIRVLAWDGANEEALISQDVFTPKP